jgi:hypothetical protein
MVTCDGDLLKLIPEEYHTYELCMKALNNSWWAVEHVKQSSEKLYVDYIKSCRFLPGKFLSYIKNPTEDICLEAYKRSPDSINFITLP